MITSHKERRIKDKMRGLMKLTPRRFEARASEIIDEYLEEMLTTPTDKLQEIFLGVLPGGLEQKFFNLVEQKRREILGAKYRVGRFPNSDETTGQLIRRILDETKLRERSEKGFRDKIEKLEADLDSATESLRKARKLQRLHNSQHKEAIGRLEEEFEAARKALEEDVSETYKAGLDELENGVGWNSISARVNRGFFVLTIVTMLLFAFFLLRFFFENTVANEFSTTHEKAYFILAENNLNQLERHDSLRFQQPTTPLEFLPWLLLFSLLLSPFFWIARVFLHLADKAEIVKWDLYSRGYMERRMLLYYGQQDNELRKQVLKDYSDSWVNKNPADRLMNVKIKGTSPERLHPLEIAIEAMKKQKDFD